MEKKCNFLNHCVYINKIFLKASWAILCLGGENFFWCVCFLPKDIDIEWSYRFQKKPIHIRQDYYFLINIGSGSGSVSSFLLANVAVLCSHYSSKFGCTWLMRPVRNVTCDKFDKFIWNIWGHLLKDLVSVSALLGREIKKKDIQMENIFQSL